MSTFEHFDGLPSETLIEIGPSSSGVLLDPPAAGTAEAPTPEMTTGFEAPRRQQGRYTTTWEVFRTSSRGLCVRFTTWPTDQVLQEVARELQRHRGFCDRLDVEVPELPTPNYQADLLYELVEAANVGAALWCEGRRVLSTGDYLKFVDPLARRGRAYLATNDPLYRRF